MKSADIKNELFIITNKAMEGFQRVRYMEFPSGPEFRYRVGALTVYISFDTNEDQTEVYRIGCGLSEVSPSGTRTLDSQTSSDEEFMTRQADLLNEFANRIKILHQKFNV